MRCQSDPLEHGLDFSFLKNATLVVCLMSVATTAVSNEDFDYLTFTQIWPPGECADLGNKCIKPPPKNVSTWTVHGLWPTKTGTEGPEFCNNSWPFSPDQVQVILPLLEKYWPNSKKGTSKYDFWSHEWDKHGTCAESMGSLNTQLKYFSATLKLNRKFELLTALQKKSVSPSTEKTYKLQAFVDAVRASFSINAYIECAIDYESERHYVGSIEICLDKTNLDPINCPHRRHLRRRNMTEGKHVTMSQCPGEKELYYPPIHT